MQLKRFYLPFQCTGRWRISTGIWWSQLSASASTKSSTQVRFLGNFILGQYTEQQPRLMKWCIFISPSWLAVQWMYYRASTSQMRLRRQARDYIYISALKTMLCQTSPCYLCGKPMKNEVWTLILHLHENITSFSRTKRCSFISLYCHSRWICLIWQNQEQNCAVTVSPASSAWGKCVKPAHNDKYISHC